MLLGTTCSVPNGVILDHVPRNSKEEVTPSCFLSFVNTSNESQQHMHLVTFRNDTENLAECRTDTITEMEQQKTSDETLRIDTAWMSCYQEPYLPEDISCAKSVGDYIILGLFSGQIHLMFVSDALRYWSSQSKAKYFARDTKNPPGRIIGSHGDRIIRLFVPQGEFSGYLISTAMDRTLKVWDAVNATDGPLLTLDCHAHIYEIVQPPKDTSPRLKHTLFFVYEDNSMSIFSFRTASIIFTFGAAKSRLVQYHFIDAEDFTNVQVNYADGSDLVFQIGADDVHILHGRAVHDVTSTGRSFTYERPHTGIGQQSFEIPWSRIRYFAATVATQRLPRT